jgi:hypothetical protein|nr:MAG TPA: hypothetical protein [Caudoviricetes sp.]
MILRVDGFKIYILEQGIRNDNKDCEDICKGIVASMAYPQIQRDDDDGTITHIFIQGCNTSKDNYPLETRNSEECSFVLNNLKIFCNFYKEPFSIVGGRIKLC